MGDIKRKRRLFSRPKKLFDRARMDEEDILVKKYGLKNKREIWKAKSRVSKFRRRAKELINASEEEKKAFFEKLTHLGITIQDIADVLGLNEEHLLERRLQTYVHKKGFANTPKQARQLIVHKHVRVGDSIVNTPSFIVTSTLEGTISIKEKPIKKTVALKPADSVEEKE